MHAQHNFRPDPGRDGTTDAADGSRWTAIRRRSEIEAKLIAYRCGWLASDEIHIRKLTRELSEVLYFIGADDPLARQLIEG